MNDQHPPASGQPNVDPATQIEIVWVEPLAGPPSFPLDHPYVELVYAPLVGASAVLFLRRVALLARDSEAIVIDSAVMASELGLRTRDARAPGRNSPFVKALNRLEHFRLARWLHPRQLGVYRQAPALADEHLASLPASARRVHHRFLETEA